LRCGWVSSVLEATTSVAKKGMEKTSKAMKKDRGKGKRRSKNGGQTTLKCSEGGYRIKLPLGGGKVEIIKFLSVGRKAEEKAR